MKVKDRILFVINRKSGPDTSEGPEDAIRDRMNVHEIEHELFPVPASDPVAGIIEKIRTYEPGIVAAVGGDGTINMVASALMDKHSKLAIVPMGSANGLAYELGIPEKTEEALDIIIMGETQPLDVVVLNKDHICLHLSDVGINARIIKEFEKSGKRGLSGYLSHFLKELVKKKESFRCTINADGKIHSHKAYMTIIANSSSYRTGANINPTGRKDDGRFEVVVLKPHPRWVLKSFIGAFTGTIHLQPNIETYYCTRADIEINPQQELQVDGELIGKTGKVVAEIRMHALKVIM